MIMHLFLMFKQLLHMHTVDHDQKIMENGKIDREKVTSPFFKKRGFLSPLSSTHFTLIELLVVIAVVALLAGMLLPALGKAKAFSKRVLCFANMKNASLAYSSYTNNNNDWQLPSVQLTDDTRCGTGANTPSGETPRRVKSWHQDLAMESGAAKDITGNKALCDNRNLPKWLMCPSNPYLMWCYTDMYKMVNSAELISIYQYADPYQGGKYKKWLRKMSKMPKTPSTLINIFDAGGEARPATGDYIPGTANYSHSNVESTRNTILTGSINWYNSNALPGCNDSGPQWKDWVKKDFLSGRHGGQSVALFFDGHSEAVPGTILADHYYRLNVGHNVDGMFGWVKHNDNLASY